MATCKDCLYWEVCNEYRGAFWGHKAQNSSPIINASADSCIFYKDRSRFVELPKIGDTVFELVNINEFGDCRLQELKVTSEIIDTNGPAFEIDLLGERIFLTLEEAEQALKERESE